MKVIGKRNLMVIEYIVAVYVFAVTFINLSNLIGLTQIDSWVMKSTFFGPSLLVLMLLQWGIMDANRGNEKLERMRLCIMGLSIAGIVSACSLPLCLMLLLVEGYFISGYKEKCGIKGVAFVALVACGGMEIYNIAILLNGGSINDNSVGGFMISIGPDVLLVLTAAVYSILAAPKQEKERFRKLKKLCARLQAKTRFSAACAGGAVSVIAISMFLLFVVMSGVGAAKIARGMEEVYLLEDCEDTSLVLTVTEDEESGTYSVGFEKYIGKNNQKVRLVEAEFGMYQVAFLEPSYVLEVGEIKEDGQVELYAAPASDSYAQLWKSEPFDAARSMYKLLCVYSWPLAYHMLNQGNDIPDVYVAWNSGGYEFFTWEKTVEDEYITHMEAVYRDEFAPTMLMESTALYLGGWMAAVCIFIVLALLAIIYMGKIVGVKPAVLYALFFAYMLAYGSISGIVLLALAFALQCLYAQYYKKGKGQDKKVC